MPEVEEVESYLTAFYRNSIGEPSSFAKRLTLALTQPAMMLAACRYVLSLPIVKVSIPESDKPRATWLFDSRRPWKFRGFASSYIELPQPLHQYWEGQAKQNLRKATARARAAGFTVRPIDSTEMSSVQTLVYRENGLTESKVQAAELTLRQNLAGGLCVAVFDENEHAVAFCIGIQTGNAVRTFSANTSIEGQVRWLCFSGFVEEASARGARFIIESPPWYISEGNRLFTQRLGFTAARIRSN
jgi:hypothetical protein